jgi:hypothetical protein
LRGGVECTLEGATLTTLGFQATLQLRLPHRAMRQTRENEGQLSAYP